MLAKRLGGIVKAYHSENDETPLLYISVDKECNALVQTRWPHSPFAHVVETNGPFTRKVQTSRGTFRVPHRNILLIVWRSLPIGVRHRRYGRWRL